MGNYDQENYKKKVEINDEDEDSSVFDDGDHSNRSRRVSFGKNESLLFRSDTNVESLRSEAASVVESHPHGGANDGYGTNDGNGISDGYVTNDAKGDHGWTGDSSDDGEVSSQAASFCDSVISNALKEVGGQEQGMSDGVKQTMRMQGSKLEDQQHGSVESSIDLEYSRKNSTTSSQTGSRIQSARHRTNGNDTESPSSGIYRLEHENSVISPTNKNDDDKSGDKNSGPNGDLGAGDVKKAALRKVNEKHGASGKSAIGGGADGADGAMGDTSSRNDDQDGSEDGDSVHEDGASSGQNRKNSKRMKSLKNTKIEADEDLVVQGGCPCVMYCVN